MDPNFGQGKTLIMGLGKILIVTFKPTFNLYCGDTLHS